MVALRWGRNRWVLLVGAWAVKAPRCRRFGRLNNANEAAWWRESAALCPVLWASPGAWLIVMPRAEPIGDAEFAGLEPMLPALPGVERKASSWGRLPCGRVVAVDYGWR